MVAVRKIEKTMTLTLKNIPAHLHQMLKIQAKRHKRSLNQEAIHCLEIAINTPAIKPSLISPPAPVSVGSILRPFTSRSEMLDDFLDPPTNRCE